MSTDLVTIQKTDIQKGGLGFNNSKLFKLKPANLQLTQKMTQGEGVIPGKIRIKETGQMFDEMHLVFLFEPVERRSYFEGEDFTPDNQICFSMDNVKPDARAKVPQALYCAGCPKSSWEPFRQTGNKKDIPPCKNYWHSIVVDRVTQMPYYFDVRSTSIKPFMGAMQNLARMVALLQSQGKNPNIFDFSIKVFPVSQNKGTYYTYGFKDAAPISEEDKEKFGNIYLDFLSRGQKSNEDLEAQAAVTEDNEVNQAVVEPEYVPSNTVIQI